MIRNIVAEFKLAEELFRFLPISPEDKKKIDITFVAEFIYKAMRENWFVKNTDYIKFILENSIKAFENLENNK